MASDYYQTRYSYDIGRNKVWKAVCQYLSKYIPAESLVLDLGSGYCDFINNVPAAKKFALDFDNSSKQYCNPDVSFLNINALEMDFDEKSLDVVFASNLLEHLDDSDANELMNKIFYTLKESGKLILIQPNYYYAYRNYWDDFTHKKAFTHTSLSDFLTSKGFKIIYLEKKFLPFSFKSKLPKSYILTTLYLNFPWHPFAKQMLIVAQK